MNDELVLFYAMMGVMFLLMGIYSWRVEKAQNNFSWTDAFRDSDGKPSFARVVILPTWLAMTVVLFHEVAKADPDDTTFFLYYGIFWSGTVVALKLAEVVGNVFAKRKDG